MMNRFRMFLIPTMQLRFAIKSDGMPLSHRFLLEKKPFQYFGSRLLNSPSLHEGDSRKDSHLEIEIISTECIKPAVPTPAHLRTYEVSILDQIIPHIYVPFVYFYSNNHQNESNLIDLDDLNLKRRLLLKRSLAETLTRFYPLAGNVKDYRHIDCNDEGTYWVEAKASQSLSDFLRQSGNKYVRPLLPFGSNVTKLLSKTHVTMIQLTTFSCGGISIGLYASHKIVDGYSCATFLKAWAASAQPFPEDICPRFIAPSIFPSTSELIESESMLAVLHPFLTQGKSMTKRFVFRASSLKELKRKGGASRVMAVTALIWRCLIKAVKVRSADKDSTEKTFALMNAVNLRERSSPPMPLYLMGNIVLNSCVIVCGGDADIELESIVQSVKNSIDKLNGDFVEAMKGVNGLGKVREYLNEMKMFYSNKNVEHTFITSLCNGGMYGADFGWGKPIWASYVGVANADSHIPVLANSIMLVDTRCGMGIEAWVTLSREEMDIFERDPELLEMASVDPSPLE